MPAARDLAEWPRARHDVDIIIGKLMLGVSLKFSFIFDLPIKIQ